MDTREAHVLTIAEIVRDAAAAGDAALVVQAPGEAGEAPQPGYGQAIRVLAETLDAIGFEPL